MDDVNAAAVQYGNWLNENLASRNANRDAPQNQTPDQQSGKGSLEADLKEARGSTGSKENSAIRDASRDAQATHEPDKQSGNALLADDLNAAKEGGNEADQSHDPGRSR
jgi:hypothetical protein